MRHTFLPAVLLSSLLSACTTAGLPSKSIDQSGALKVHPGLLGQPVPPELQPQEMPRSAPAARLQGPEAAPADGGRETPAPLKLDEAGLRTQRSVYFDLNSSALKGEFEALLRAHGRYLAKHPKARVRVEGNADERGPAGYNRQLGQKRAETVKQGLIAQGAKTRQVKATTLGELKPKLNGHDEESWAENRRADIVYEKVD